MSRKTDIAAEILGLVLGAVMALGFLSVVIGGVVAVAFYVFKALHGG